ncbi:hypothetical protein C3B44_08955 [Corynebacterium yudongzhengii]|uniref:Uncharacterized protein n=2 Tax=Corynebacterium yudongzhengii TaxID=2080740 RepID=A0A2U1T968_9CORY|nr:hypothetical protein C3B44_08955 [Corynebacterium yudongzhengii]PWC02485.1 hypothetical protein DF222_02315 [Corynebacterium yudongzhengii]
MIRRYEDKLALPHRSMLTVAIPLGGFMATLAAGAWVPIVILGVVTAVAFGMVIKDLSDFPEPHTSEYRDGDIPFTQLLLPLAALGASFFGTAELVEVPALPTAFTFAGSWALQSAAMWWLLARSYRRYRVIGFRRRRRILEAEDTPEVTDEQLEVLNEYAEVIAALYAVGAIDGVILKGEHLHLLMGFEPGQLKEPIRALKKAGLVADGGIGARESLTITPAGVLAVELADQRLHRGIDGRGADGPLDGAADEGAVDKHD